MRTGGEKATEFWVDCKAGDTMLSHRAEPVSKQKNPSVTNQNLQQ